MSGSRMSSSGPTAAPNRRRVWGWLLLAPAVVLMIVQLIVPGIRTVLISLRGSSSFGGPTQRSIGIDGYRHLEFASALAGGLACGALLLVVALVTGPVIALLLARATPRAAAAGRALLGLMICCYAPIAMVLGVLSAGAGREPPAPDHTGSGLPGLMLRTAMIYLPVVVAGSALVWSAVLGRGGNAVPRSAAGSGRPVRPLPVLVGAAVVAGGCLAGGLQSFDVPVLLAGGQMVSPANLILYSVQSARFDAAAAACCVLMIIIAVLGLLAGVLLVITDIALVHDPAAPDQFARPSGVLDRALAWAAPVAVLVVLLIVGILHRTWVAGLLKADGDLPGPDRELISQTLFNTWVPSGIGALLQVTVALLAAAAIGYVRPLGERSRWLLLIFAPWLFAGDLALILAEYDARAGSDPTESWVALIPSVWVIAPAIFVLSWLFDDLRRHHNPVPIIGAALLTSVICWLLQAQQLLRPMFLTSRTITAPLLSFRSMQTSFSADGTLWLVLPLPVLLSAAVIAAAAILMLGRVRLVAGRSLGRRQRLPQIKQ